MLWALTASLWRASGALPLPDEAAYVQDAAAVRATPEADTFATAWTDGATMLLLQAIDSLCTADASSRSSLSV